MPGNVVPTERQTAEIMAVIVKVCSFLLFLCVVFSHPPWRLLPAWILFLLRGTINKFLVWKTMLAWESRRLLMRWPREFKLHPTLFMRGIKRPIRALTKEVDSTHFSIRRLTLGSWKIPLRTSFAFIGNPVKKWAFLVIKEGELSFNPNGFMERFIRECKVKGLNVPRFTYSGVSFICYILIRL